MSKESSQICRNHLCVGISDAIGDIYVGMIAKLSGFLRNNLGLRRNGSFLLLCLLFTSLINLTYVTKKNALQ